MNLSEEKKEPLRKMLIESKKHLLKTHYKTRQQQDNNKSKLKEPQDYITFLSAPDLSPTKVLNCLESLRVELTNKTLTWVQDFGTKGLQSLLSVLNECYRK